MAKYRVSARLNGMICDEFDASSEMEARKMMYAKYSGVKMKVQHEGVNADNLLVSEDVDEYLVDEV